MTLSLRQKRRQETAFHIQRTTLELSEDKGLENVTTEEIASASGVSTRTFFNYYPNKEAAAVGHPPKFTEEQKDALRNGSGPLAAEIKQLLDQHIAKLSAREDILRMLGNILKSNEKARGILEGYLAEERRDISNALFDRVGNRQIAAALAINVSSAIGGAIMLWEHEKELSLHAALDVIWEGTMGASRLLASPVDQ
ncbi:TetR/AcrR family transcriptional regulator [Planktotalea sp.]|uniref:TetR/AcrR family transcriptional regulator n=1 Tax=Planktotalea sp. TaxID=2029877 RepID=UPI003299E6D0